MSPWVPIALSALLLASCSSEEAATADEVKGHMNAQVQPAAEVYWQAVQYISDESGDREIKPETDADWMQTATAARDLQLSAKQMLEPRFTAGRGADWADFAQGLMNVAQQAEQAALAKDPEQVLESGGTIYNVCSACHEVYMTEANAAAQTSKRFDTVTE